MDEFLAGREAEGVELLLKIVLYRFDVVVGSLFDCFYFLSLLGGEYIGLVYVP